MAADFKSHVLLRDEKGFAGVPFKRLLLGGVSGGLVYTLVRLALPALAIPAGLAAALVLIVLTAPRGGLPLFLRLVLGVRGWLLLRAANRPESVFGSLARALQLPLHLASLDGAALFAPAPTPGDLDLREWALFAQARDADHGDGLVFVEAPLSEVQP